MKLKSKVGKKFLAIFLSVILATTMVAMNISGYDNIRIVETIAEDLTNTPENVHIEPPVAAPELEYAPVEYPEYVPEEITVEYPEQEEDYVVAEEEDEVEEVEITSLVTQLNGSVVEEVRSLAEFDAAIADASVDTIMLFAGYPITLDIVLDGSSQRNIDRAITIDSADGGKIIAPTGAFRVAGDEGVLTLRNVTVQGSGFISGSVPRFAAIHIVGVSGNPTVNLEEGSVITGFFYSGSGNQGAAIRGNYNAASNVQLNINGGIITENSTAINFAGGKITMTSGEISWNQGHQQGGQHAFFPGGGAAVMLGGGAVFEMTGGSIHNNRSNLRGAAITSNIATGNDIILTGGEIYNNRALRTPDVPAANAMQGGAIFIRPGNSLYIGGDVEIYNNEAYEGGAIYINSAPGLSSTFTMTGGTIRDNIAHTSTGNGIGGGIFITGANTEFNMSSGLISGNTADIMGGGIYIEGGAEFNMTGGTISDNTASDGGGIYIMQGVFDMSGGLISDNEAHGLGGGIFANVQAAVEITGGIIGSGSASNPGNKAEAGAGIWAEEDITLGGDALIARNNASDFAGGVRARNLTMLGDSVINYNTAYNSTFGTGHGTVVLGNVFVNSLRGLTDYRFLGQSNPNITQVWSEGADRDSQNSSWGNVFLVGNLTMSENSLIGPPQGYTPNMATVTFRNNHNATDDSTFASVDVDKGQSLGSSMPADPTRTGFSFTGWSTARSGGSPFNGTTTVYDDITVYAQWQSSGGTGPGGPGPGNGGSTTDPGSEPGDSDTTGGGTTILDPLDDLLDDLDDLELYDLEDTDIPLGAFDDDEYMDIEDEDVPLGAMPQTGLTNNMLYLMLAGLALSVVLVGFAVYSIRKSKKE